MGYTKAQKEIRFLRDWRLRGGRNFKWSLVEVSASTYRTLSYALSFNTIGENKKGVLLLTAVDNKAPSLYTVLQSNGH